MRLVEWLVLSDPPVQWLAADVGELDGAWSTNVQVGVTFDAELALVVQPVVPWA